jgi:drug/metabolite transporter (DMT)-like permease
LFETTMLASGAGAFAFVALLFLSFPAPESWPYLAGSVAAHLFYYLLLAYAYKAADMSYAYTIMRGSSPLFTALVAVFLLGDWLAVGGWAGVLLLSAGILVLAVDSIRHGLFKLAPTLMALGNALVIMGYTVIDGAGVRLSGNAVSYICCVFFLNSFPILIFSLAMRGGEYFHYARTRWQYGLFGGLCSFVAYGLSVWAMARAPIPLVAALRETSVIFGMLLAVLLLKECLYPARIASVLLVAAGAMAIKFFA